MAHNLQPFAHASRWTFRHPAAPDACVRALQTLLARIAAGCSSPSGQLIGHIKAYVPLPAGGFIRGNIVSAHQAPDVELRETVGKAVTSLDVSLNVLVVGLERDECRRRSLVALDEVAARHGFEHETLILQPQGER